MSNIPRDPAIDSTLALWREGYEFIWNRCRRYDSDLFLTRVMGRKTVCIHGVEAAALFYDERKFARHGGLPRRVVTSLFGKGAVHTLDDAAHRERKAAFMSLMRPESMQRLMDEAAQGWRRAIRDWQHSKRIVLLDETQQLLTEAVCNWAGVPVSRGEIARRARDLAAMVDAFGGVGPRLWRGKAARMRTERWIARYIEQVRERQLYAAPDSALSVMAQLRDHDGRQLDAKTAAVELINVLRPTVAIAWYIVFAAHALHRHPQMRDRIARESVDEGAGEYTDLFMQEVRRFYPFTPFLGARVRQAFEWRGQQFEPGTLVLLDVHGTDHDPTIWDCPEEFRPERFRSWSGSAFDFIPHGGGQHATGHRCPGEWITMHNLALALHFLTRCASYQVEPKQDLDIDLTRMPTQPASGFVIQRVRATFQLERPAPRLPSRSAERGVENRAGTVAEIGLA